MSDPVLIERLDSIVSYLHRIAESNEAGLAHQMHQIWLDQQPTPATTPSSGASVDTRSAAIPSTQSPTVSPASSEIRPTGDALDTAPPDLVHLLQKLREARSEEIDAAERGWEDSRLTQRTITMRHAVDALLALNPEAVILSLQQQTNYYRLACNENRKEAEKAWGCMFTEQTAKEQAEASRAEIAASSLEEIKALKDAAKSAEQRARLAQNCADNFERYLTESKRENDTLRSALRDAEKSERELVHSRGKAVDALMVERGLVDRMRALTEPFEWTDVQGVIHYGASTADLMEKKTLDWCREVDALRATLKERNDAKC